MATEGGPVDLSQKDRPATAEEVEAFHEKADTDARPEAIHHTLGTGPNQAASGDHNHRGGNSLPLLSGLTITGSRGSDAYRLSINQILVALGATDSSTA